MKCFKDYFTASFVFAIATIVEAISHVCIVGYGYYLTICGISPRHATIIFFYLTYLYNNSCGILELEPDQFIFLPSFLTFNDANFDNIIQEILNKSVLPERANAASRMFQYIVCFLVADAVWLVASIALLMGVCLKIKQIGTLVFYGPWLVTTVLILLLDIIATVHFSLDLFETTTLTAWMRFVGIENIDELQDLDSRNTFNLLSITPTLAVLSFTTKFIIFWIINIFGIYYVAQATILAYRQSYEEEEEEEEHKYHRNVRNNLDLDTTAARIRNWQLFYGAIESETNHEGTESSSSSSSSSSNNHINFNGQPTEESQIGYTATNNNFIMDELRSQKPWSYVESSENMPKLKIQQTSVEKYELSRKF